MGVTVKTIKPGEGKTPKARSFVKVHYTGRLTNGKIFDSSVNRKPFKTQIGVGKVIRGWDEGIVQMQLGEKAELTITPDYAYGDQAMGDDIPANSTLIFEVELLEITD